MGVQDQMRKAFDADRRSQDKAVEEIISSKQELQSQVETLKNQIADRDEQLTVVQDRENASRRECKDLTAKYEDCREELAVLLDKTLNSKDKADELTTHYMKIEDDLRQQLQSVQSEREGIERKLTVVQRESDRLMEEFYKEKHEMQSFVETKDGLVRDLESKLRKMENIASESVTEAETLASGITSLKKEFDKERQELTSTLTSKEEIVQSLGKQIDEMKDSQGQMSSDLASLKKCKEELQEGYDKVISERDSLSSQVEKFSSNASVENENRLEHAHAMKTLQSEIQCITAEKDDLASSLGALESKLEEERLVYSKTVVNLQDKIDRFSSESDGKIEELESKIEAERLVNDNAMAELQSVFENEVEEERNKSINHVKQINTLRQDVVQLREEVHKLNETKSRQVHQIKQLKNSLKDAIEEALRLGSKVALEQSKLAEITHSMSTMEEENLMLKQSSSDGNEISKLSLKEAIAEKRRLERQLTDREAIIMKAKNDLTQCELKLIKVEDENTQLQNNLGSIENAQAEKEQELINQIVELKMEGAAEKDRLNRINEGILAVHFNGSDECSMSSGASRASHLKRTASELETTIKAIKKHHSETVRRLQNELEEARRRASRYEKKVKELTCLIQENSFVIESLHKKLRTKKKRPKIYSMSESQSEEVSEAIPSEVSTIEIANR